MPSREADDQLALVQLAADPDCAGGANSPEAVRTLWDVCQIPDFRKTMTDAHIRLLKRIWRHLCAPEGRVPADWAADQMAWLDRTEGDIDTLTTRIAHIRTWTYIAHSGGWLENAKHWQERARAIEDRLSDALHDRLTQRFVDRRTAVLSRLKDKDRLDAGVSTGGEVTVEGEYVGRLEGFRFAPDSTATGDDRKALLGAANRALQGEIASRVRALTDSADDAFMLGDDLRLAWRGAAVARIARGTRAIDPAIEVLDSAFLSAADRETMRRRLVAWLDAHIARVLAPLVHLDRAGLSGPARGVAFQLVEALGTVARGPALDQAGRLSRAEREALRALGVRIGAVTLYVPALLKPAAVRLRALLWAAREGAAPRTPPAPGLVTVKAEPDELGFFDAVGYPVVAGRAIRADMLERLDGALRQASRKGPVVLGPALMSLAGLGAEDMARLVVGLGWREVAGETGPSYVPAARRGSRNGAAGSRHEGKNGARKPARRRGTGEAGPFAKLRELELG